MTDDMQTIGENQSKVGRLPNPFGKYEIVRELGSGGMGSVYEARDTSLVRRVALKIPHAHLMAGPMSERFVREARLAARLDHPNICTVLEFDRLGETHYLALSYIEGNTLAERALQGIEPRQAALWVRKCALALEEAHRLGIVHRDLKPANIMINQRGEPIVMDFGLAKGGGEAELTEADTLLGTPAYMPMEQLQRGYGEIDARSDIYSLGAVFYELLVGRPPFSGTTIQIITARITGDIAPPSLHHVGIQAELEAICLRALSRLPKDRYPSMRAFASDLEKWLRRNLKAAATKVLVNDQPRANATVAPRTAPGGIPNCRSVPSQNANTDDATINLSAPVAIGQCPLSPATSPAKQPAPVADLTAAPATPPIPASVSTGKAPNSSMRTRRMAIAGTFVALLVLTLATVFEAFFNVATVHIVLSDPNAAVKVRLDGETIELDALDKPIRVKPGGRELVITGDDFETVSHRFTLVRGAVEVLNVALRPHPPRGKPKPPVPESEPWNLVGTRPGEQREFVGITFCWCPPGNFVMGSPANEFNRKKNEEQVPVRLKNGFWLGKFEITQAEWKRITGVNPSHFSSHGEGKTLVQGRDTNRFPVECVSWHDATAFCAQLTQRERQRGGLPENWMFTLPTEAQWEYACRAGTSTPFHFGNILNGTHANANGTYGTNEKGPQLRRTAPVGSYGANAWNLHDMHGNVWEWCLDGFEEKLPGGADPLVSTDRPHRVRRGGSWYNFGWVCRAASRYYDDPNSRHTNAGFRLALIHILP